MGTNRCRAQKGNSKVETRADRLIKRAKVACSQNVTYIKKIKEKTPINKKSKNELDVKMKEKRTKIIPPSRRSYTARRRLTFDSLESNRSKNLVGFARGLKPAKIVGVDKVNGRILFQMKWIGTHETDMVPSEEASLKCPQLVLDFYEARALWCNRAGDRWVPPNFHYKYKLRNGKTILTN